ncbi:hypothetical protein Zmor_000654 [Zophobas morio]|uniref:Uncharacterized protein n=1 Tax=Zophobas morio TaxID=2755281 RepID=A0AA38J558_9CUCU|nr:hypothetical protein Zmor_000654 [Zophobas morio]
MSSLSFYSPSFDICQKKMYLKFCLWAYLFLNRRARARNRISVTGFFSVLVHASCTATALPSRVAVPSSRDFQFQGRRPQVQEEPVLKEVAAQEERPCGTCYFFTCCFIIVDI